MSQLSAGKDERTLGLTRLLTLYGLWYDAHQVLKLLTTARLCFCFGFPANLLSYFKGLSMELSMLTIEIKIHVVY